MFASIPAAAGSASVSVPVDSYSQDALGARAAIPLHCAQAYMMFCTCRLVVAVGNRGGEMTIGWDYDKCDIVL